LVHRTIRNPFIEITSISKRLIIREDSKEIENKLGIGN
jgi:hypothetical protein